MVEGQRRPRLFPGSRRGAATCCEAERPAITFLCSPNNPTGLAEDPARRCGPCWRRRPGLVVVDEAYGQFADWSALTLIDDERAARRHPDLLQDLVDGRRPARLPHRAGAGRRHAGAGGPPVPPRRPQTGGGAAGCPLRRGNGGRGWLSSSASGSGSSRPWPAARHGLAVAGQLHPVPARAPPRRARCGSNSWSVRSWCGIPRRGRGLADCLRVTVGTPGRTTPSSPPWPRCWRDAARRSVERTAGDQAETAIEVSLALDGSGLVSVTTGLPFFDHMVAQLGKHAGFDLSLRAQGDLQVDAHHTVEDVGILLGECLREALGDKAGVRRFASDRGAARRGPDLRGPRPVRPALPRLPGRPGRGRRGLPDRHARPSTRSWPRSSGGPW